MKIRCWFFSSFIDVLLFKEKMCQYYFKFYETFSLENGANYSTPIKLEKTNIIFSFCYLFYYKT